MLMLMALPISAATDFEAGLAEYKSSHYQQAAILFKRSAERTRNPQDFYWAAQSLCMAGQKVQGIQQFWSVVRSFPKSREASAALAALKKLDPDFSKNNGAVADSTPTTVARPVLTKEFLIEGMVKVERSPSTSRREVDESFVDKIKTTLKEFPLGVLWLLSSKGCKIKIAPTIIDADMRLQHSHPGGYETDSDFKQVPAMFDMHDVIIAEYVYDGQGNLKMITDCAGNLRHEMGHAFDVHDGDISDKDPFKHSYWNNWGMPLDQRPKFAYYLRGGRAGPAETLAELFCVKYGGRSKETTSDNDAILASHFKQCMADLNAEVERVCKLAPEFR
jgi:hypothetical protein